MVPDCPFCHYAAIMRGEVAWCRKCGALMDQTGRNTWIAWKHEAHPEYLKTMTGTGDA